MGTKYESKRIFQINNAQIDRCCTIIPVYEIIYNLGTKWLVCNECLEFEEFSSDIKEKVRIEN
jgi:hypothetical protein